MERINPPKVKALMLKKGALVDTLTLQELGIYSSLFIDVSGNELVRE